MTSTHSDQKTLDIIKSADKLLTEVRRSMEDSDNVLRDMGLNPDKVRKVLAEQPMTQAQRDEAMQLFRADMEDVEREVAHATLSLPSASSRKPPRSMV